MSSVSSEQRPSNVRRGILVLLPLLVFLGIAGLFYVGLREGDPSILPSALIGKPMPKTDLPPVEGLLRDGRPVPGLTDATFKGKVTLVNVWASWCVPCHDEVPFLAQLSRDKRVQLVGINYKDAPADARRFLGRYGNPYAAAGADRSGRESINWGVYGVPETYVVDRDGTITYKLVGPIDARNLQAILMPAIDKALRK
ncbi:MAG TPA: DsbE family thiol:disulfide interchange protein [Pseudolabrys sp.]|nr:DsbE family thiol:disulfide interchange protein [Pseudolabrys sp.]